MSSADNVLKQNLRKLDDRNWSHINSYKNYLLGRILTIVDAAIADVEQRKAIKDLMSNAMWDREYHTSDLREDLRLLCQAQGYGELFPNEPKDETAGPTLPNPFQKAE